MEEKRRAAVLAREAALRHTGLGLSIHPRLPSGEGGSHRSIEQKNADESDADNYSVLMSHFTRQHNVEPQDIRTYLGVGPDYEDLC